MAPIPSPKAMAVKRSSAEAGLDIPHSSNQRRRCTTHHSISRKQSVDIASGLDLQDAEGPATQLVRAISLVLDQIGFSYADAPALESFLLITQEFMSHFLSAVRQSMLASRCAQPSPYDFLSALNAHNLTLSSLLPHLDPPVPGEKSQPPLFVQSHTDVDAEQHSHAVGNLLRNASPQPFYIPSELPLLPSRHTYKAEPVYAHREVDPKKVRVQATEEGRLGEEALRRLVMSRSRAENHLEATRKGKSISIRQRGRDLWKETMTIALKGGNNQGDIGVGKGDAEPSSMATEFDEYSIRVNSDSIYWRKPVNSLGVQVSADS